MYEMKNTAGPALTCPDSKNIDRTTKLALPRSSSSSSSGDNLTSEEQEAAEGEELPGVSRAHLAHREEGGGERPEESRLQVPEQVHRQGRVYAGDEAEEEETVRHGLNRSQHCLNDLLEHREVVEEADGAKDPDRSEGMEDGHVAVEGGGDAAGDRDEVKHVPTVAEEGTEPVRGQVDADFEAEDAGKDNVKEVRVEHVVLVPVDQLCCKDAVDETEEDTDGNELLEHLRPVHGPDGLKQPCCLMTSLVL